MIRKTFLTVLTLMGFFFGVSSNVKYEITIKCETFLTIFALIGFFFGMSSNVSFQSSRSRKMFLTILAFIRFFFGMSSGVTFEMTTAGKTFLTIFAFIAGFFCTSCNVRFKITGKFETFLTVLMLIWVFFGMISIFSNKQFPAIHEVTLIQRLSIFSTSIATFSPAIFEHMPILVAFESIKNVKGDSTIFTREDVKISHFLALANL
jgi:hypothetical protein